MLTEDKKKYHQIIKHTSNLGKQKQGMIINILQIINIQIQNALVKLLIYQEGCQRNKIEFGVIKTESYQQIQIKMVLKILKSKIYKQLQKKKRKGKIRQMDILNINGLGDKYEYYSKAISYDWTHLSVVREVWEKSQRQDFSFMNLDNLKKLKYTLQMRIIPINKASPLISSKEQMRPIIVMSHVIKMIELFYEEKLKQHVNWEINPEQIGFIQGMGTLHIQEIIRYLKTKGMKGKTAIFIDLSNAYNVVNREKLYQILKKRGVFGNKALNFLFSFYDELYFWDDWKGEKVKIENGLHQGSILSPYLFDIYFDELINEWKQKMRLSALAQKLRNKKKVEQMIRSVKILAFADDVVYLNNKYTSEVSFQLFNELAKDYNFQINLRKTNFIQQTKKQDLIKLGFNWVESYKYLGVWINVRGSLKPHYQIMKKIVKKNSWREKALSKLLPARHVFKLWQSM